MNAIVWARRHSVALGLGSGFVALHAAAYGFFASHNPYSETIFPPCIILHFTGLQCPGCGGTRAMYSLLHGDAATSIAMNPMVVAGYLALAIAFIGVAVGRSAASRYSRALYWAAGLVAAGATVWSAVIRNLIS